FHVTGVQTCALPISRRELMDQGAVLLWPAEENLYALMCMRVESGRAAFEREKQGSPISPELCEWPETYFDESVWFDEWPTNMQEIGRASRRAMMRST